MSPSSPDSFDDSLGDGSQDFDDEPFEGKEQDAEADGDTEDWLGLRSMQWGDPDMLANPVDYATISGSLDFQCISLRDQIQECLEKDIICYVLYHGTGMSDDITEAEAIYPSDTRDSVDAFLRSWKNGRLQNMEILDEWPENVKVYRRGRPLSSPPNVLERFCASSKTAFFECLGDVQDALATAEPDLRHNMEGVLETLLEQNRENPLGIERLRVLIFDLLELGGEYQNMASSFIRDVSANQTFDIEPFDPVEVEEARQAGICKKQSTLFYARTGKNPSSIDHIAQLQWIIEQNDPSIWEDLYTSYCYALRPTTPEEKVRMVLIPLFEQSQGSRRSIAYKNLHRLGYREENGKWRRLD